MATPTKLSTAKPTTPRVTRRTVSNVPRAHQGAPQDQIEDAQLNAIADEHAEGPFVKVSLDDLQPSVSRESAAGMAQPRCRNTRTPQKEAG